MLDLFNVQEKKMTMLFREIYVFVDVVLVKANAMMMLMMMMMLSMTNMTVNTTNNVQNEL